MPRYELLIDGERRARVKSEDEIREWIARYCEKHAQDDPTATHVQVIRLKWLGGELIPRENFLH